MRFKKEGKYAMKVIELGLFFKYSGDIFNCRDSKTKEFLKSMVCIMTFIKRHPPYRNDNAGSKGNK
jgi:hypothetical protein